MIKYSTCLLTNNSNIDYWSVSNSVMYSACIRKNAVDPLAECASVYGTSMTLHKSIFNVTGLGLISICDFYVLIYSSKALNNSQYAE